MSAKPPMSEGMKTAGLAGLAAFLCILAVVFGSRPDAAPVFDKIGSEFYPDFQDPLKATALEVIEYDEAAAFARPFKVELAGGKWSIPSHSGYPADAKERLAKTATSVIGLKKDQLASETEKDHESLGVVDPLDGNVAGGKGRGKRVTFYAGGAALATFVFGKEAGEGKRYVRVPTEKQTWIAKTSGEVSAKFEDWVETDLLQATAASLRRVVIDKYSFDEAEERIKDRVVNTLVREDAAKPWTANEMKETEELNESNVNALVTTLDDLKIAGVRRKPPVVARAKDLNELAKMPRPELRAVMMDLAPRGFFVASLDGGKTISIVCNEGEMAASCEDGVVYSLRFGEVIVGAGEQISAGGKDEKKDGKKDGAEHRFLFVGVRFDESLLGPAPVAPPEYKADPAKKPEDQKMDEAKAKAAKDDFERKKKDFEQRVADGKKRKDKLEARFAEWYYVISGESFKKLRLDRAGLVKPKEKKEEGKPGEKHDDKDGHKHDEKPGDKPAPAKPEEKPSSAPKGGAPEGAPVPAKPEDKPAPPKPEEKKP